MYRTKVQYLQQQNSILKKENTLLSNMLDIQSQENKNSIIFQLKQQNQSLHNQISQLNDAFLLQKQSRIIEYNIHQQCIEEYNIAIFRMKQQIKKYELMLKEEKKAQQQLGVIQKWVRSKIQSEKDEIFHKYANPVLFFNILSQVMEIEQEKKESQIVEQTCQQASVDQRQNDLHIIRGGTKWFQQQSQIYFIRKNRKQNLHLKLQRAKIVQHSYNRQLFKNFKQQPLSNHKLLKQSYVNLILEHQRSRKQLQLYKKYIQQLQARNSLLIESNLLSQPS